MKVFTYFDPVPEMAHSEQQEMISIWKASWRANGWQPLVLSRKNIAFHPLYEDALRAFKGHPTVNPKEYELACWLRWLAMAMQGGVMTDFDVLCFGFRPEDIPENPGPLPTIFADANPCPCAVHGTERQYENVVRLFMEYKRRPEDNHNGVPHLSDQNALQAMADKFRPYIFDMCPEYNQRHWREAKLVHFCHAACAGKDRLGLLRNATRERAAA